MFCCGRNSVKIRENPQAAANPIKKKADPQDQKAAKAAQIAQEVLAQRQKVRATTDSPPTVAAVHASSWDGSPDGVAKTKTTEAIQKMLRDQRDKDLAAGRIKKKQEDPPILYIRSIAPGMKILF